MDGNVLTLSKMYHGRALSGVCGFFSISRTRNIS